MTKAYEKECSSVDEKHPELSGEKCEVKTSEGVVKEIPIHTQLKDEKKIL